MLIVVLLPAVAAGQPDFNFKRIRLNWPYVEVYFSVGCNGVKNYQLKPADVRLYEDGREVTDFGLWCPDPTSRCPISVGLVFDASDSMKGEGSEGAKHGGTTFIGNMDDLIDQACVIHFNESVWVYQHMTTDTVALKQAVSLLPSFGATALWDGIFTALAIVQNNGENQCRAVIVLSDGEDNSSKRHGLPDVISFAVLHNIRVFPIGYGENIAEDDLRMLAELTGGQYFQTPNAEELASIYREISTILYDYFQECLLSYEPRCGDYEAHEVELRVEDLCGGDASLTKTYYAPMDSTTYREKHIGFGEATVMGGAEIRVPIELRTPLYSELLYPMTIDMRFDRSKLHLRRVETPAGTLLEGVTAQITDLIDGGRMRFTAGRTLEGSGVLAYAVFQADHHTSDASYVLHGDAATFEKGCLIPVLEDGVLHVTTSRAVLACGTQLPDALQWDGARHRYEPDPLTMRFDLSNTGTMPAADGSVSLHYDPAVFELVDGSQVYAVDTLHAGGQASQQWKLVAKPQSSPQTAQICVRSAFAGVEELQCCAPVQVPAAGMLLSCALTRPPLQYSEAQKAFVPNPFELVLEVDNQGAVPSGALSAVLQLPEGLYVESGTAYEKAVPEAPLQPGATGAVRWQLRVISMLGGEVLPVRVELQNDGTFYRSCSDTVRVPAIPPVFVPTVTADGATSFCAGDSVVLDAGDGYLAYRWNTGAQTRFITVRVNGSYVAMVRDAQGRVGQSQPVEVTVQPAPPKPVISRDHNLLSSSTDGTLQWYRNGSPISGATERQFQATQTGVYVVRVRNAYGCESVSDPFTVNILSGGSIPAAVTPSISVHPQPVRGMMQVRIQGVPEGELLQLRVHDLLGRVVLERRILGAPGATLMLDAQDWPAGMYLLGVIGQGTSVSTRILKR